MARVEFRWLCEKCGNRMTLYVKTHPPTCSHKGKRALPVAEMVQVEEWPKSRKR